MTPAVVLQDCETAPSRTAQIAAPVLARREVSDALLRLCEAVLRAMARRRMH